MNCPNGIMMILVHIPQHCGREQWIEHSYQLKKIKAKDNKLEDSKETKKIEQKHQGRQIYNATIITFQKTESIPMEIKCSE